MRDVIRGEVTFANDAIEDFVLLRGNGTPLFVLANVVDDIEMGITHVVRAEEHLPNTPKQQLLWDGARPRAAGVGPRARCSSTSRARSCRSGATRSPWSSTERRATSPTAMVNYLMTLGWAPSGDTEIVPWSQIEAEFRLEDVTHSPAFFDLKKLAAFNGDYIRAMPLEEFIAAVDPWLPVDWDGDVFAAMAPLVQTRVVTLAEVPAMVDFLFEEPKIDEVSWVKAMGPEWAAPLLDDVIESFGRVEWEAAVLKAAVERIGEGYAVKPGKAQAPVRVAVTGRSVGPPLFESLELLGRDRTLARLRAAQDLGGVA